MTEYALVNFSGGADEAIPGLRVGDLVVPIGAALARKGQKAGMPIKSTRDLLWHWEQARPMLDNLAQWVAEGPTESRDVTRRLEDVRLLAPILYPDAIFCAFANFTDHMKEMSDRSPPDKTRVKPFHFLKLGAHCVIGPEEPVRLPAASSQVDWEAELAVVIGRRARNVAVADAMDYVAGYTIINDLSLRDLGRRDDWNVRNDFLSGKSFDTGAPMGPWIVPKDQIDDVYKLSIRQWVGGELMQDSNTGFMHFTIEEQIAELSRKFTLRPGDVIATGSPSGNGRPRGIYLQPGQDLTIEISGIGRLHNPVVQGD